MRSRWTYLLAVVLLVAACSSSGPNLIRPVETTVVGAAANPDAADAEPILAGTVAGGVHCGYERWAVKTGTDPLASKVNLTPKPSTVAALGATKSPLPPVTSKYPPQTKRQQTEEQTYTVRATLTRYAVEQDNDFHLVLTDGKHSMIAEIPNPLCVGAASPFLSGVTAARKAFIHKTGFNPPPPPPGAYSPTFVKTSQPVTVTGVRFYDFPHAQAGVAPNAVELHPVLSITFG